MAKLDERLRVRQTDRNTAEALRKNCEGLLERGIEPSVMDIRYIKLADYENREEDLNRLYSDLIDCPRAGVILSSREMDEDECYE